jgi:hypothetical protein
MKIAEARAAAIRQARIDKLEHMLIYAMRNDIETDVETAGGGLIRLGARPLVERYAALYIQKLPPFEQKRARRKRYRRP